MLLPPKKDCKVEYCRVYVGGMNGRGLVCREEVDLLGSVSTWEGCRARRITTSRDEGR